LSFAHLFGNENIVIRAFIWKLLIISMKSKVRGLFQKQKCVSFEKLEKVQKKISAKFFRHSDGVVWNGVVHIDHNALRPCPKEYMARKA
jgi:hypothetical protein